ncbi:hypothetical protein RR46_14802 [Papilio xuthus]|uniref:Uncharacterized protein n=1 Tax=Papilio xuthus TaxID=66420 RepID=A0A194PE45_PAPXU|nr:hypothetical protein RR46_14802 [Papilio xuthus]
MITEVVTDVRDTIDCTVEAVEGALSLGSTISNPKCRGAIRQYQDKNGNRKGMSLNIRTDTSFHGIHYNDNYRKDIPKPNTYEEDKKYKFKNNDDRFENIKRFLKDEFEKMSASMRMQFKEIESEEKSASDAIIKYINILHNMKHNSKSDTEINEAKRILDGASKILNVNIKNGDTDDAKVNKILTTLEQGSQHEKVMQNTLSKIAENKFTNDRQNNSHLLPETFKDIFNKALSPSHVKDNTEERNHEIEDVKSSPFHGIDLSHHSIENVEPIDYDSLFGGGSHSESNNDALDDATKILEDSKRSSSILSNLFAQAAQAGSSIFDNPEPF